MTGHQVNLRFDEAEIDRLKEIAERNEVEGSRKQEPFTKLIRDTIQAVHFSSTAEQANFLAKYAYKRNVKKQVGSRRVGDWDHIVVLLEAYNLTPELFERDWLPMIETVQKINLDISGTPDDIYRKASRLGAVMTVVNAVSAKSEMVRQTAIKDLMDRSGYKPDNRQEIHELNRMSDTEVNNEIIRIFKKYGLRLVKADGSSIADGNGLLVESQGPNLASS